MDVSCEIGEYFKDWRDWFLLEEDKEKGLLELFVNNKKVLEKNVLNHFILLECRLEITNFDGVISSIGSRFNSSSLCFSRTIKFNPITTTNNTIVSIGYNIGE